MRLSMKFKEKSEQCDLLISLGQHRAHEDVGKRLEEGELLFAYFDDILSRCHEQHYQKREKPPSSANLDLRGTSLWVESRSGPPKNSRTCRKRAEWKNLISIGCAVRVSSLEFPDIRSSALMSSLQTMVASASRSVSTWSVW